MPYPTTFPLAEAKLILGRLTGSNTAAVKDLAAAEYEVQGYVFGQVFGNPNPPVWGGVVVSTLSDDEAKSALVNELDDAILAEEQPGVVRVGAVNWKKWLALLVRLLPLLLLDEKP